MVYLQSSISVCNPVDQSAFMASNHHQGRSNRNKTPNSQNCLNIPDCDRSRSAAVDVVILLAVIGACGYLLFPYVKFVSVKLVEVTTVVVYLVKEEVSQAPLIYGSMGISISCAALAAWVILVCTGSKCGNPKCKGLRKAAEFDIQLETEECVKNSNSAALRRGLFEFPRDHHRELEAELKKMAPPNGRAVLVFRARCGCSVGRMEVPGLKRHRKVVKRYGKTCFADMLVLSEVVEKVTNWYQVNRHKTRFHQTETRLAYLLQ